MRTMYDRSQSLNCIDRLAVMLKSVEQSTNLTNLVSTRESSLGQA